MHGLADYLIVLFLWSSPTLFVLPDGISRCVYMLGFAFLFFTVCTDSTSGIFRFFSMPLHGLIEFGISIILLIISYTFFNYDERSKNFFITLAVIQLVLYIVTDYTWVAHPKRTRRLIQLQDSNTAL
ncbi:hypothetical protein A0256_07135 [Mucilaginibacter sp. PAMC 26640]|nr:hypothetical protein A0256_07135 [Mucilaginibacter sp. PAMC 26640]